MTRQSTPTKDEGAELQVAGLRSLGVIFDTLPDDIERRALNASLRSGAAPIRRQARANAPLHHSNIIISRRGKEKAVIEPGRLRNNIRIRTLNKKELRRLGVPAAVEVYVRWNKRWKMSDKRNAWFYWWVEFGHRRKGGGYVAAQPYMRPAYESQKGFALRRFMTQALPRIATQAKRLDKWQHAQLRREVKALGR